MTTDKTLATVKHGGCVQLGDGLEAAAIELWHRFANEGAEEWADEVHKAEYRLAAQAVMLALRQGVRATQEMVDAGAAALLAYRKSGGDYRIHPTHAAETAINAALSAQPSPGGQDALTNPDGE